MAVPLDTQWMARLDRKGCALSGVKRTIVTSGENFGFKPHRIQVWVNQAWLRDIDGAIESVSIGTKLLSSPEGEQWRKSSIEVDVEGSKGGSLVKVEQQRALLASVMWSLCFLSVKHVKWGEVESTEKGRRHFMVPMNDLWLGRLKTWAREAHLGLEDAVCTLVHGGLGTLWEGRELESLMRMECAFGFMTAVNFQRWGFQWWMEALETENPLRYWVEVLKTAHPMFHAAYSQSQTPFSDGTLVPLSNVYDGIPLFPHVILSNAECFVRDFLHAATQRAAYDVINRAQQKHRNDRAKIRRQMNRRSA